MPEHALPASPWPLGRIPAPRRASVPVIVGAVVLATVAAAFFQRLAFRDPARWFPPLLWSDRVTGGLADYTLVANVTLLLVLIGGWLMGLGGMRPADVGLRRGTLGPALGRTVLIWIIANLTLVVAGSLSGTELARNPAWSPAAWRVSAGEWIGQLLGNCLYEEMLFRGVLLPQVMWRVLRWWPAARRRVQVAAAILISQGAFSLTHVFFNSHQPEGQWLLVAQLAFGLLYAGVYLRTGNLLLAVGIHVLVNNPAPLLNDPVPGPGAVGGLTFFGVTAWLLAGRWLPRRRLRATERARDAGASG